MRIARSLCLFVLAAALPAPGAGPAVRLSPGAEAALAMPASVVVGAMKVTFAKGEDGVYRPRYEDQMPVTVDPSDDGSARKARRTAEIAVLAPFADADGSGDVSLEEGLAFRQTLEFGLAVVAVGREEGTSDPAKRAGLLGLTSEDCKKKLAAYRDLRTRMKDHARDAFPVL